MSSPAPGDKPEPQLYDMSKEQPVKHQHDTIVGNELRCSVHSHCSVILIKPTQVLERDANGVLQLVDKDPALQPEVSASN